MLHLSMPFIFKFLFLSEFLHPKVGCMKTGYVWVHCLTQGIWQIFIQLMSECGELERWTRNLWVSEKTEKLLLVFCLHTLASSVCFYFWMEVLVSLCLKTTRSVCSLMPIGRSKIWNSDTKSSSFNWNITNIRLK